MKIQHNLPILIILLSAPSRAPQNVSIKSKESHDQLELSWDLVSLEFVHGDLKGYKILYTYVSTGGRTIGIPVRKEAKTHPYQRKLVLKNLVSNSVYTLEILAVNEYGDGIKSSAVIGGLYSLMIYLP